jgi:hypothetical protein
MTAMSSHQKCEPALTARFPPELCHHWVKRLARLMGVPHETARHWAFRRLPDARRKEIALALIAECDRLQTLISQTRQRWAEVADEAGGAVVGRDAYPRRPGPRRVGQPRRQA